MCIHVYSSSVSSASIYKAVIKDLITPKDKDRSGAPKTSATTFVKIENSAFSNKLYNINTIKSIKILKKKYEYNVPRG